MATGNTRNTAKIVKKDPHFPVRDETATICRAYLNDEIPIDIFYGCQLEKKGFLFEYAQAETILPRESISAWEIKFTSEKDAEAAFEKCFHLSVDTAILIDQKRGVLAPNQTPEIILAVEELSEKIMSE